MDFCQVKCFQEKMTDGENNDKCGRRARGGKEQAKRKHGPRKTPACWLNVGVAIGRLGCIVLYSLVWKVVCKVIEFLTLPQRKKLGSMQNKQAAQAVKKALEEDPTVFQYDEVYDDMDKERSEKKEKAKADRKPKYIQELMKTAEKRQRENERRIEKQVQKDLEKEGDKYKDKEAFVTSAYKKKMEELKRLDDEEKRQDALDEMTEVTKQHDLSGFYRHLYRSTMEEPGKSDEPSSSETKKTVSNSSGDLKAAKSKRNDSDESDDEPKVPPSRRSITPEDKRKSTRRNSDSHDHHRSAEKERSSSHRHHHHRDYRERSRSRDRGDRDHHSRRDRDSDRHRDRDRGRDKRDNRDRDDRYSKDYHRGGDHDKRRGDHTSHRDRSHRHHPYARRDRDHHGRSRDERARSRSPPRKDHVKSSTHSGKIEGSKENYRPASSTATKAKADQGPQQKLSEHPVWKKRTAGQVLEEARERYFERKRSGVIRAIVVKDR